MISSALIVAGVSLAAAPDIGPSAKNHPRYATATTDPASIAMLDIWTPLRPGEDFILSPPVALGGFTGRLPPETIRIRKNACRLLEKHT